MRSSSYGSPRPVLSSRALSLYRSQWMRYQRGLLISPASVQVNLSNGFAIARYEVSNADKVKHGDIYHQIQTTISDEQLDILERSYSEYDVDGNVVTFKGKYRNVKGIDPAQGDGSVIVQDATRLSLALIPQSGNEVRADDEGEVVDTLQPGVAAAYQCNCEDYGGRESFTEIKKLGEVDRQWGFLGQLGGCKHILSLRTILVDLPEVPKDLPIADLEAKPSRSKESFSIGKRPRPPRSPRFV